MDVDVVFRDERERAVWIYQQFLRDVPALQDVIAEDQNMKLAGGIRDILFRILSRRSLGPTAEEHARIDACSDLSTLKRWVEQAAVATSVAEALA